MVLLISYICGILVELKLLQVVCNRTMVLKPKRKKKLAYNYGQKASLNV